MLFNRLALFRTERGLTRKALAEAAGVNPQTIGFLERGDYKPSLELALKICAVLESEVEMVFSLHPFESLAEQMRRRAGGAE